MPCASTDGVALPSLAAVDPCQTWSRCSHRRWLVSGGGGLLALSGDDGPKCVWSGCGKRCCCAASSAVTEWLAQAMGGAAARGARPEAVREDLPVHPPLLRNTLTQAPPHRCRGRLVLSRRRTLPHLLLQPHRRCVRPPRSDRARHVMSGLETSDLTKCGAFVWASGATSSGRSEPAGARVAQLVPLCPTPPPPPRRCLLAAPAPRSRRAGLPSVPPDGASHGPEVDACNTRLDSGQETAVIIIDCDR
eukprot:3115787-Rhodomonas_salina.1